MSYPQNYADADALLQGRNKMSRKLGNNTYCKRRDGDALAVMLHETDVVTFHPDGWATLDSGGWKTVTTSHRINECGFPVWSDRGIWYLNTSSGYKWNKRGSVPYADGMRVNVETREVKGAGNAEAQRKARKRVLAYCKAFIEAFKRGEVEAPGAGDCWYCGMETEDGKTLGEAQGSGKDHIWSHVLGSYYVPSLLWTALERRGASRACKSWVAGRWQNETELEDSPQEFWNSGGICEQQALSCLKSYVYQQLGMAS